MHELGLCSSIVGAVEQRNRRSGRCSPLRARCLGCADAWELEEVPASCPACGGAEVDLVGGDELMLEWIEYRGKSN